MSVGDLLEEAEEGDQISIDTEKGILYGEIEITREYTEKQRNRLERIKEELGRPAAKNSSELMEAEGEIIAGTVKNEEGDYEIEINPMSTVTHVTLKEEGKTTDLSQVNEYLIYSENEDPPEEQMITSYLH